MSAAVSLQSPWAGLLRELDHWRRAGEVARFWVRDDDAIALTPQLERLSRLARAARIEVGLAVIPARLTEPLAAALREPGLFFPMCHGWRHVNYCAPFQPSEFGPDRPLPQLIDDAKAAQETFARHFGAAPAVFVPPYSRIAPDLVAKLPEIGFVGLSVGVRAGERRFARLAAKFGRAASLWPFAKDAGHPLDVHIDPFDWRRGAPRPKAEIAQEIVGYLRARRYGAAPRGQPIGLLLHHLVFDERTWNATEELVNVLAAHPAVAWPAVSGLAKPEARTKEPRPRTAEAEICDDASPRALAKP